jgi:hypothetical protein
LIPQVCITRHPILGKVVPTCEQRVKGRLEVNKEKGRGGETCVGRTMVDPSVESRQVGAQGHWKQATVATAPKGWWQTM